MFRKSINSVIFAFISCIVANSVLANTKLSGSKFVEGTHYIKISDTGTKKPEVVEYFTFYCPHCYGFEPTIKKIKADLAKDVFFDKRPILMKYWKKFPHEVQRQLTKAFVIGKLKNKEAELIDTIFDYIHKEKGDITKLEHVRDLMIRFGVKNYDSMINSEEVESKAAEIVKYEKAIDAKGVLKMMIPAVVINDQYAVVIESVNSAKEPTKELQELINYLLTI